MAKVSGQYTRVFNDGKNMSAFSQTVNITDDHDAHDVVGFSEAVHNFIPGQRTVAIAHTGLMDADTSGVAGHDYLGVAGATPIVTVQIGENAAPDTGDSAFILNANQSSYAVSPPIGGAIPFTANYVAASDNAGGWGKILTAEATIAETTTGETVDGGALSTGGAIAALHILTAAVTDTYVFKVRDSTDDDTYADLIEFTTLDGSAVGGEYLAATGTADRYIQYEATVTGTFGEDVALTMSVVRL